MSTEARLSRLIGDIYACVSTGDAWPETLVNVSDFTGATSGHLLVFPGLSVPPRLSIVGGLDPASGIEYDQHYAARDPRLAGMFRNINDVVACHQVVDPDAFDRSEIVNDFLLKWDARFCLAAIFPVAEGCYGVWGAMLGVSGGFFREEEQRRLALLLPHIRQAVSLQSRLGFLEAQKTTFERALDLLATAVFAIDRRCRLHYTNQVGEQVLREAFPLRCHEYCLEGARPSIDTALKAEAARNAGTFDGTVGIVRTNKVVVGESHDAPGTLLFYPLRGHAAAGILPGAEIIVFLLRGEDCRPPTSMLLRVALGLTTAEADLALALSAGERLRDIAERKGVSLETARSQLKSIFLKTKTRRQSEIIRLVQAQSSVALRPAP